MTTTCSSPFELVYIGGTDEEEALRFLDGLAFEQRRDFEIEVARLADLRDPRVKLAEFGKSPFTPRAAYYGP